MAKQKKSEFIPETTKTVEVVPDDLKNQWGAIEACSLTLGLFDQGYFSPRHTQHIAPTMAFLSKLHEQAVENALKHPQAHMIPELKKLLDEQKDVKNGKTKSN